MNPECDRCLFNAHDPHILCAVHPEGVEGICLDFRPDLTAQDEEEGTRSDLLHSIFSNAPWDWRRAKKL